MFIENHILSWDRMFISFDYWMVRYFIWNIELRERECCSRLGIFNLWKINLTKRLYRLWNAFNKLTSVFHASVLLLIMNFVITLSK